MSEIKRVVTPMANTMMVLDQGEEVLRSPSGLSRRPLKKATSEGLISISSEPGNVKFEVGNQKWLESEGKRCSSAGRIERKLQLFKKKEDTEEQRRNSTDGIYYKPQPDNPLVTKLSAIKISNTTTTAKNKLLQDEKPSNTAAKPESESSESESESDESESDDEETKGNVTSNEENKVMAPIEVKAEFIQCVMSGNYAKAQEICKQILLLEPDNATCKEFHSVIVMKIEQENMQASDDDNDSDDDDDDESDNEDDDDDEEEDDDNEEDDSDTSSSSEEDSDEEDFTVAPGLNLLMGGLPIKPQSK